MRIAVIAPPFVPVPPDGYGGTELIVHELTETLVRRGHRVMLFATGDSRSSARLLYHSPRAVWPPDPYLELDHSLAAVKALRLDEYDVVHAHVPTLIAASDLIAAPLVYTVHHARDEALGRLYARHPEVTYAFISARQRRLSPPLPATAVVHHGLDPRRFVLGSGGGGYLLFLARFAPEKGVHLAIDIAQRARLPLKLAGRVHPQDGVYYEQQIRPRLEQARRMGASIEEVGEARSDRKLELLGGATALLAPIEWEEPFGLATLEAMLCGTPVIGFGRGAMPELVQPGVTGWLVDDVAEAVDCTRRLADFDRRRCRTEAMARFSVERMTRTYEAVYELAVAEWHRHRPAAGRGIPRLVPSSAQPFEHT